MSDNAKRAKQVQDMLHEWQVLHLKRVDFRYCTAVRACALFTVASARTIATNNGMYLAWAHLVSTLAMLLEADEEQLVDDTILTVEKIKELNVLMPEVYDGH